MTTIARSWTQRATKFLDGQFREDGAASVPGGAVTLYGTCYALMGLHYLGFDADQGRKTACEKLIRASRVSVTGLYAGPELSAYSPPQGAAHDMRHLQLHSTCSAALPAARLLGLDLEPIAYAQAYCDSAAIARWQDGIDWRRAWLVGNEILFVGQLLLHLRDVERRPSAVEPLSQWFAWLDQALDPDTGLWGTNGFCSPMEAAYGGYHQLLLYYHEGRAIQSSERLVDTVLSLQHLDGGFDPRGNAGACEDVDCVDILVNCYKRVDYRRADMRRALRRCLWRMLATQGPDGGFAYRVDAPQNHMGIPGTEAGRNVSCTFPTWFRVHTAALIAEIIPDDPHLKSVKFRFNNSLSMGWHASPPDWRPNAGKFAIADFLMTQRLRVGSARRRLKNAQGQLRRGMRLRPRRGSGTQT